MSGEILAALLVAIAGLITALGVQARALTGEKFQRRVDSAAQLLSGYTEMVGVLRTEVKEGQAASATALEAARDHARRNAAVILMAHEREQEEWRIDKAELKAEIERSRVEIDRLNERVNLLLTQVYVMQNGPPTPAKGTP